MCNLLDNFVCDPMRVTVSEKGLSVTESPFFVSIYFLLRIYKILLPVLQISLYIPQKVLSANGGYKYGTGGQSSANGERISGSAILTKGFKLSIDKVMATSFLRYQSHMPFSPLKNHKIPHKIWQISTIMFIFANKKVILEGGFVWHQHLYC